MTSDDIINLLAGKHSKDVFVAECKDGPTWGASVLKIDAWALRRSWANPLSWAYEVKVSRNDFLRDDKWQGYLELCNEFYFVCPPGLIMPNELPAEVGLLWVSKNAKMLVTKKKAARRIQQLPESLYMYLLICRTKVVSRHQSHSDRDAIAREWRKWLAADAQMSDMGHRVSRRIAEKVADLEHRTRMAEARVEIANNIESKLKAAGINLDCTSGKYGADREIDRLLGKLPPGLSYDISKAIDGLTSLQAAIADVERIEPRGISEHIAEVREITKQETPCPT